MPELELLKQVVERSSEFSKAGNYPAALKLLIGALTDAIKEDKVLSVRVLSRHAAVISGFHDDLPSVERFYETLLAYEPGGASALYGLAKVLRQQGRNDEARQYAVRCYQACTQRGGYMEHAILELLIQQWPDLRT
jgi:uncharacterized membrane-anchored protein